MFSKTIAAIVLTSSKPSNLKQHSPLLTFSICLVIVWLGALATPAGQVTERDCRVGVGAGCLREDEDTTERATLSSPL